MKWVGVILSVAVALTLMVGMYWLMDILPVVALFALAAYYAFASSRSTGGVRR